MVPRRWWHIFLGEGNHSRYPMQRWNKDIRGDGSTRPEDWRVRSFRVLRDGSRALMHSLRHCLRRHYSARTNMDGLCHRILRKAVSEYKRKGM